MSDATCNLNGGFKRTTKRSADLTGPDFFPTPKWATFALIENETFNGDIWEICGVCRDDGVGAIVLGLAMLTKCLAMRDCLGLPPHVRPVGSIGYQTARFGVFSNEA